MKNFITNYKTLMSECESPLDYGVAIFINLLAAIVVTGLGKIAFEAITNPLTFSDATWGIFDTLG